METNELNTGSARGEAFWYDRLVEAVASVIAIWLRSTVLNDAERRRRVRCVPQIYSDCGHPHLDP